MSQYDTFRYTTIGRWASYWHQIKAVCDLTPNKVLEVGIGNKTVYTQLKLRGIDVTGVDIDSSLSPDIVASVEKLPFEENTFDVVLCAEVLEHLPFELFEHCLKELARVSKRYVVLTLPHWGRHFSFDIGLPFFGRLRKQVKLSIFFPKIRVGSPHQWEIGKKGTPIQKVRQSLRHAGFTITKDDVLFEMPYHHLFVLEKCNT